MNKHLEKYLKARDELMTKIGRYVLSHTDVESLKEFKQKYVVLSIEDEDVRNLLFRRESEKEKLRVEAESSYDLTKLNNTNPTGGF
ncbi:TPA: hypothetical protein ACGO85_002142 [Streptococcus suis]